MPAAEWTKLKSSNTIIEHLQTLPVPRGTAWSLKQACSVAAELGYDKEWCVKWSVGMRERASERASAGKEFSHAQEDMRAHTNMHTHTHKHAHTHTHTYTHIHTHTHTHTCGRAHIHTHTRARAHTHTQTQAWGFLARDPAIPVCPTSGVLQCIAVCCSVVQCGAVSVWCSVRVVQC